MFMSPAQCRGGRTPPQLRQRTGVLYPPRRKFGCSRYGGGGEPLPRPGERAATAVGGVYPPRQVLHQPLPPHWNTSHETAGDMDIYTTQS